jgi:hypothetical protein
MKILIARLRFLAAMAVVFSAMFFVVVPVWADTSPAAVTAANPDASSKKWKDAAECQQYKGQWVNNDCYYTPVPIKIGVSIGGLTQATLSTYLAAAFNLAIGAAAILAVIFIMVGGFRYIAAAGGGEVEQGKDMIKNAIIGLVLTLLSYTLLQTVNPAILALSLPPIRMVKPLPTNIPDNSGCDATTAVGTIPVNGICKVTCQQACVSGARCAKKTDDMNGVCVSGAENTACVITDDTPCKTDLTCCPVNGGKTGTCQKTCSERSLGSTCVSAADCSSTGICATLPSFSGAEGTNDSTGRPLAAGSKFCSTGGNGKFCSSDGDCLTGGAYYCATPLYTCHGDCPAYRTCSTKGPSGAICCSNSECTNGQCVGGSGYCSVTNNVCDKTGGQKCGTCN